MVITFMQQHNKNNVHFKFPFIRTYNSLLLVKEVLKRVLPLIMSIFVLNV